MSKLPHCYRCQSQPCDCEDGITLYCGDSQEMLPRLPKASISLVCTDPPYALTANKRGDSGEASLNLDSPAGRSRVTTGGGFMGQAWDSVIPGPEFWQLMAAACKPGAMLASFGGTRTYHRLTCAIEDAGWEIRDCMQWLFGTGFPKSLDVSKAIDKAAGAEREVVGTGTPVKRMIPGADQDKTGSWIKDNGREFMPTETAPATDAAKLWNGYGTALAPAFEPIILAMKSLDGTFSENAIKHGVAGVVSALNVSPNTARWRLPGCSGRKPCKPLGT